MTTLYTGQTDKLLGTNQPVSHKFLQKCYETGQILSHPSVSALTVNKNEPDMMDEKSDQLWKMQNLFEILNEKFSKFKALLNIWP